MTTKQFTWVPLYRELAQKLASWENRQDQLIDLLEEIRAKGYVVTPLIDRDENREPFLIKEIDPFTFFGSFNRGIRNEHRMAILAALKKHFRCVAELPSDFDGIPILNNQRSWFISYQYHRKRDDTGKLWRVFQLALVDKPLNHPAFNSAFDEALEVRGVNVNLTMGLFWIHPDTFLSLDNTNRSFLHIDLKQSLSSVFYRKTLEAISKQHKKSFVQISYDAYNKREERPSKPALIEVSSNKSYWFVGAYWSDREPQDQTQHFVDEGIWQNGYADKYLNLVNEMQVGDRIAIKAMGTQKHGLPFDARGNTVSRMTIKAVGTIVANRGDGRTVEVEWDTTFEPKEWYFFTYQKTIWRLRLDADYLHRELAEKLIQFAFGGAKQDYEWFRDRWYDSDLEDSDGVEESPGAAEPYNIEDIIAEGAFAPLPELQQALSRLEVKKNLILQGAPGVGKTFLARRLAFALMEEKDDTRVEFVQFHQSYSYEDFIRGYRPNLESAGNFGLEDGVFLRFCKRAHDDPDRAYVFIIDEINRGNLSQIFGELLMLIEADKRGPSFALPLMYMRKDEPRFHVPNNLYLIGMMNLADRSLALVDYALRRRFAFMTLNTEISGSTFRDWLEKRQMQTSLIDLIVQRTSDLNQVIADDPLLGKNYQIGHSFFCPKGDDFAELDRAWYEGIIQTEIVPLLNEYWFDNAEKAGETAERLLAP